MKWATKHLVTKAACTSSTQEILKIWLDIHLRKEFQDRITKRGAAKSMKIWKQAIRPKPFMEGSSLAIN